MAPHVPLCGAARAGNGASRRFQRFNGGVGGRNEHGADDGARGSSGAAEECRVPKSGRRCVRKERG